MIADVSGDGSPEIIQGGDSSALHAFTSNGTQAPAFPKFHTGWEVFGPTVGDLDGNGRNEVVAATREGYLMVWNTPGKAGAGDQWWSYRHDERNTGTYGIDTRPPGALRSFKVDRGADEVTFKAPGDDWYNGKVDHYRVARSQPCGAPNTQFENVPATAQAGATQAIELHGRVAAVFAVDDAGNRDEAKSFAASCGSRRPAPH